MSMRPRPISARQRRSHPLHQQAQKMMKKKGLEVLLSKMRSRKMKSAMDQWAQKDPHKEKEAEEEDRADVNTRPSSSSMAPAQSSVRLKQGLAGGIRDGKGGSRGAAAVTGEMLEDVVEQLLNGLDAYKDNMTKAQVQEILVVNLQTAFAQDEAIRIMSQGQATNTSSSGAAAAAAARKGVGLLSFNRPEDCFAVEREELHREMASLQKIIDQKDAERDRLIKKAAETERGLRQQIQGLETKLEKANAENRALEATLVHQDALVDRSMEKLASHKQDIRELKVSARSTNRRRKDDHSIEVHRLLDAATQERRKLRHNLDTLRLVLHDGRVEWARERSMYERVLDEATTTINILDRMAKDLMDERGTLDTHLIGTKEGKRDVTIALDAARREIADLQIALQENQVEAHQAQQGHEQGNVENSRVLKAMEERLTQAEEACQIAEEERAQAREDALELQQQLLETANEAADSLTLATTELEALRGRVTELEEYIEVISSERADLMRVLQNGYKHLVVTTAWSMGEDREENEVKALQRDFKQMLERLKQWPADFAEPTEADDDEAEGGETSAATISDRRSDSLRGGVVKAEESPMLMVSNSTIAARKAFVNELPESPESDDDVPAGERGSTVIDRRSSIATTAENEDASPARRTSMSQTATDARRASVGGGSLHVSSSSRREIGTSASALRVRRATTGALGSPCSSSLSPSRGSASPSREGGRRATVATVSIGTSPIKRGSINSSTTTPPRRTSGSGVAKKDGVTTSPARKESMSTSLASTSRASIADSLSSDASPSRKESVNAAVREPSIAEEKSPNRRTSGSALGETSTPSRRESMGLASDCRASLSGFIKTLSPPIRDPNSALSGTIGGRRGFAKIDEATSPIRRDSESGLCKAITITQRKASSSQSASDASPSRKSSLVKGLTTDAAVSPSRRPSLSSTTFARRRTSISDNDNSPSRRLSSTASPSRTDLSDTTPPRRASAPSEVSPSRRAEKETTMSPSRRQSDSAVEGRQEPLSDSRLVSGHSPSKGVSSVSDLMDSSAARKASVSVAESHQASLGGAGVTGKDDVPSSPAREECASAMGLKRDSASSLRKNLLSQDLSMRGRSLGDISLTGLDNDTLQDLIRETHGEMYAKEQRLQQEVETLRAELDAVSRDNKLMQDRLEGTVPLAVSSGQRQQLFKELEILVIESEAMFTKTVASREGRSNGEVERRELGRLLSHIRRLLASLEPLVICQDEEREQIGRFLHEVFAIKKLPPPALLDRATGKHQHQGPTAFATLLARCKESFLQQPLLNQQGSCVGRSREGGALSPTSSSLSSAAAASSSPARISPRFRNPVAAEIQAGSPQVQRLTNHYRRQTSLRQTVEALLKDAPERDEELEELLKEKWGDITKANDYEGSLKELESLRIEKEKLSSTVDRLKERCEGLQQEVERLCAVDSNEAVGRGRGCGRGASKARKQESQASADSPLRNELRQLQTQLEKMKDGEQLKTGAALHGRIRMYEAALEAILSDAEPSQEDFAMRGRDLLERVVAYVERLKDTAWVKEAQSAVLEEGLLMALEEFGSSTRPGAANELVSRLARAVAALKVGLAKEKDRLDRLIACDDGEAAAAASSSTAAEGAAGLRRKRSITDVVKQQLQHEQEQLDPSSSQPLIERLEDYVSQVQHRAGGLHHKLKESHRVNVTDRRRLQDEFERLKAQVAAFQRESHEVEKAIIIVLQDFMNTKHMRTKDLGPRLKTVVASLKKEVDDRCMELETVTREAEATRHILESEVNEVKAEVALLRRLMGSYEEALWSALGVREGDLQGKELAVRLREHVEGLNMQVEERSNECEAMREERMEERSGYLKQIQGLREQASMYCRFAHSFGEAVRTVFGLNKDACEMVVVAESRGGGLATEGEEAMLLQQQEKHTEEVELGVEEVKALCIKLLQYGARVQGEAEQRKEQLKTMEKQLKVKEKELLELKKKLSLQGADLSSLQSKVKLSYEEMTTLRQRLAAQESDISTLVSSMTKVSDKLHLLQSQREMRGGILWDDERSHHEGGEGHHYHDEIGGRLRVAASSFGSSASTRGAFALETSLHDVQSAREGEGGRLAVNLLEESLAKNFEHLRIARAKGERHASTTAAAESSSFFLLMESEDPLNDILSRPRQRPVASSSSSTPRPPAATQGDGGNGPLSRSQMMMKEVERNLEMIERLESQLRIMKESRNAGQREIDRFERLLEEQSKTINALAARNAALEIEVESLPQNLDLNKLRADKRLLEMEVQRLQEEIERREADAHYFVINMNRGKEKMQKKIRDQEMTVNRLTLQVETLSSSSSQGGRCKRRSR